VQGLFPDGWNVGLIHKKGDPAEPNNSAGSLLGWLLASYFPSQGSRCAHDGLGSKDWGAGKPASGLISAQPTMSSHFNT
jgi:hypothetical protein